MFFGESAVRRMSGNHRAVSCARAVTARADVPLLHYLRSRYQTEDLGYYYTLRCRVESRQSRVLLKVSIRIQIRAGYNED